MVGGTKGCLTQPIRLEAEMSLFRNRNRNRKRSRRKPAKLAITQAEITADLHYPAPKR